MYSVVKNHKSEFINHNSKHPLPITPHRLPIRSGRSICRNRDTAIRALAGGRVTFLVLVLTLVDGFVKLLPQLLESDTTRVEVEAEVVLGIAGREDATFIAQREDMSLELFHDSGKERVELLFHARTRGCQLHPLLVLLQFVHIPFPCRNKGLGQDFFFCCYCFC